MTPPAVVAGESRGTSVSGVALGDAGSRGRGWGGDGQGPAASAAQEDAGPPGSWQRRSGGQVTGSCPRNRVGGAPGEGNEKGWDWGWGIAGNLRRKLDRNQGELKGARP